MSKKDIGILDRLMNSTIDNICQSMFDDFVRVNAEASNDIGLKALIIRQEVYKCCDWCHEKAGIYKYGEEPREVYQRHDNCKCVVLFKREKGIYQDVWSKEKYAKFSHAQEARKNEINRTIEKNSIKAKERVALLKEWENTYKEHGLCYEEWKNAAITRNQSKLSEEGNFKQIGTIKTEIYSCVTKDITTDQVIITNERIKHIKERHPNDYEQYVDAIRDAVENPDYIIESAKEKTALVLKESRNKEFKTILRLHTSTDNPEFKNSVITFMKINTKEWERLLRNKRILYKRKMK